MVSPTKLWTASKILGVIAGALAWTAALISYSQDGRIKFGTAGRRRVCRRDALRIVRKTKSSWQMTRS